MAAAPCDPPLPPPSMAARFVRRSYGRVPLSGGEEDFLRRKDEAAWRQQRLLEVRRQEKRAAQLVTQRYRDNLRRLQTQRLRGVQQTHQQQQETRVSDLQRKYALSLQHAGTAQRQAREMLTHLVEQAHAEQDKWAFNETHVTRVRSSEAARLDDAAKAAALARRQEVAQNLQRLQTLSAKQRAQASVRAQREHEAQLAAARVQEAAAQLRRNTAKEEVVTMPRPHRKDVDAYQLTRLHSVPLTTAKGQADVQVVRHNRAHPSAMSSWDAAGRVRDEMDRQWEQKRVVQEENAETAGLRGEQAWERETAKRDGTKAMEWLRQLDRAQRGEQTVQFKAASLYAPLTAPDEGHADDKAAEAAFVQLFPFGNDDLELSQHSMRSEEEQSVVDRVTVSPVAKTLASRDSIDPADSELDDHDGDNEMHASVSDDRIQRNARRWRDVATATAVFDRLKQPSPSRGSADVTGTAQLRDGLPPWENVTSDVFTTSGHSPANVNGADAGVPVLNQQSRRRERPPHEAWKRDATGTEGGGRRAREGEVDSFEAPLTSPDAEVKTRHQSFALDSVLSGDFGDDELDHHSRRLSHSSVDDEPEEAPNHLRQRRESIETLESRLQDVLNFRKQSRERGSYQQPPSGRVQSSRERPPYRSAEAQALSGERDAGISGRQSNDQDAAAHSQQSSVMSTSDSDRFDEPVGTKGDASVQQERRNSRASARSSSSQDESDAGSGSHQQSEDAPASAQLRASVLSVDGSESFDEPVEFRASGVESARRSSRSSEDVAASVNARSAVPSAVDSESFDGSEALRASSSARHVLQSSHASAHSFSSGGSSDTTCDRTGQGIGVAILALVVESPARSDSGRSDRSFLSNHSNSSKLSVASSSTSKRSNYVRLVGGELPSQQHKSAEGDAIEYQSSAASSSRRSSSRRELERLGDAEVTERASLRSSSSSLNIRSSNVPRRDLHDGDEDRDTSQVSAFSDSGAVLSHHHDRADDGDHDRRVNAFDRSDDKRFTGRSDDVRSSTDGFDRAAGLQRLSKNESESESLASSVLSESPMATADDRGQLYMKKIRERLEHFAGRSSASSSIAQFSLPLSDSMSSLNDSFADQRPPEDADDSFVHRLVPMFPELGTQLIVRQTSDASQQQHPDYDVQLAEPALSRMVEGSERSVSRRPDAPEQVQELRQSAVDPDRAAGMEQQSLLSVSGTESGMSSIGFSALVNLTAGISRQLPLGPPESKSDRADPTRLATEMTSAQTEGTSRRIVRDTRAVDRSSRVESDEKESDGHREHARRRLSSESDASSVAAHFNYLVSVTSAVGKALSFPLHFPAMPPGNVDMQTPPAPLQWGRTSSSSSSSSAQSSRSSVGQAGDQVALENAARTPSPPQSQAHDLPSHAGVAAPVEATDGGVSDLSRSHASEQSDDDALLYETFRRGLLERDMASLPPLPLGDFDMSRPPPPLVARDDWSSRSSSTRSQASSSHIHPHRRLSVAASRPHGVAELELAAEQKQEESLENSSCFSEEEAVGDDAAGRSKEVDSNGDDRGQATTQMSLADAFRQRHPRFQQRVAANREQQRRKREALGRLQQQQHTPSPQRSAVRPDDSHRQDSDSDERDDALPEAQQQLLGRLAVGERAHVSPQEMKERTRRLYQKLPEVVERRRQEEVVRRRQQRLAELREQEKVRC